MKRLALALAIVALAATPALAGGPVQSIADATAARGWPHPPSAVELRDLAWSVRPNVTRLVGTRPRTGRCVSFRVCTYAWRDGRTARVVLRVYEDGSWIVRSFVGGGRV